MLHFIFFFWAVTIPVVSYEISRENPPSAAEVRAILAEQKQNCEQGRYDNTLDKIIYCK